jgi:hypothetical protein
MEPWNRFPGTTTLFIVLARQATLAGGIDFSESIPGLLKRLQIRPLEGRYDKPFPTRILTPIDCLKIPALVRAKRIEQVMVGAVMRLSCIQLCIYSPHRWSYHHLGNQSLRSSNGWRRHDTYLHPALHIFSSQMGLSTSTVGNHSLRSIYGWGRHETYLHPALHIFSSQMGFSSSRQSEPTQHSGVEQT